MNETTDNAKPLIDLTDLGMRPLIQCAEVRLISAYLTPLIPDTEAPMETQVGFRIRVVVTGEGAYAYLEVQITAGVEDDEDPDEIFGYRLNFILLGLYTSPLDLEPSEIGEFARMNALATLWPYAREYAGDQFQRAGEPGISLPVIDPNVVTQHLVEEGLLEVVYTGE